jgi:hypothetical protein
MLFEGNENGYLKSSGGNQELDQVGIVIGFLPVFLWIRNPLRKNVEISAAKIRI